MADVLNVDCNTCLHHKQATDRQSMPGICVDCLSESYASPDHPNYLPNWQPKAYPIKETKVPLSALMGDCNVNPSAPFGAPDVVPPPQAKGANAVQIGGSHYKDHGIQPWDFIVSNKLGFLEGNVIKYVVRYAQKNGVQDLQKAKHYLDKLIEVVSKETA